jgi:hypothetical protein
MRRCRLLLSLTSADSGSFTSTAKEANSDLFGQATEMIPLLERLFARRNFDLTKSNSEIPLAVASILPDEKVLLDIPMEMLVMHGASKYSGGWHPFVAALTEGPDILRLYYKNVRPRSFEEFYHLQGNDDLPPWALPWVKTKPPTGEGLGLEHGVSYYGPSSSQKVTLEYDRLVSVANKIRENGYRRKHCIRGYLLKLGGEYRFFVRGGKHRAAAFEYLGGQTIPARFCSGWPRLVDHDQAEHWPMVREELISKDLAQAGFRRYFEFDGTQHLRKCLNVK